MSAKKPNEINIIRIYDAPVKTVWDAWTDPAQAAQWWGPRGFTITTHSKDLKPGGTWIYTMHGPDGVDYPNHAKYREVEKYARLVYEHGAAGEGLPYLFLVTVTFAEVKGKTKMDMTMALPTAEEAERTKAFIKKAGGNATWDRLAEYLEKGKDIFVINRSFEAPVGVIFDLWTKPEHFTRWLPPTGFNMKFIKADIKEGGSASYAMTSENGQMTMHGAIQYKEIRRPDRIVYTQRFTDAQGNISRHPMAPTWPETMQTTVTLAEEGANRTRVTVQWEVYGKASKEEVETFKAQRAGMTQGWTGSFDKLDGYLETVGEKATA